MTTERDADYLSLQRELAALQVENEKLRQRLEARLCCEPDGSPDQNFHYCEQCREDLAVIYAHD